MPAAWRTARRHVPLGRALVAGVLNVTPDSFSDGGRHLDPDDAIRAGLALRDQGADLLDVGGESTRPGAAEVDANEEARRVVGVIERLAREADLPISVDTRRAAVARAALEAGAEIINDVSGLTHDPDMAALAAATGAGVVVMHMRGTPATMDGLARYSDVAAEVAAELADRVGAALQAGIVPEAIVVDPGLGFAKTPEQNWTLLGRLAVVCGLGYPVMVGPSRKRFLGALTGRAVAERDDATAAACVAARLRGASLFRVHNVARCREALAVADATLGAAWTA
jgi:dihydropteroate synthase